MREAEGVAVMVVVMVVVVVSLVVMVGDMVVVVVMVVVQSCVGRSHSNRCPERRLRTPNQGHRRHRRRCRWSKSSCRNSYAMSSRSSIVSSCHSCNNKQCRC